MILQKIYKCIIKSHLSVLVGLFYFFATAPVHYHTNHHTEHEHATSPCQTDHQADACHNYIYHGELNNDCKKHHHASENDIDCLICHTYSAPKSDYTPTLAEGLALVDHVQAIAKITKHHFSSYDLRCDVRGPPAIV